MSSGESVAENVIDADHQVAVLVPCYNEEHAVAKVVADFRAALPAAAVYVYDNNSTDKTVEVARARRRHRAPRDLSGQRSRRAADVQRHRSRHLRAGGWRRHLRCGERARHGGQAPRRASRHGGGDARRARASRVSRRPSRWQPHPHRLCRTYVRPVLHRHLVGLPGVLAALREIVSGAFRRF